ncbi:uap1l1, partial [Symbiodinium microadriaticum]
LQEAPAALRKELESLGFDSIRRGQVAAVILSGGQGTRLGYSGPKGMYSIGLPSQKSIFQIHIERLDRIRVLAAELAGPTCSVPHLPVYVMTSESNNNIIQTFFEENHYFNYPEEDVFFFEQGLLPCLTMDGKLIIQAENSLSMAPDGNGGVFPALQKSGAFQNMLTRGVRHIHLYGIDNILTKAADPAFIGYCIKHNCDVANKVVARANASEKVGVSATRNGRLCIVEYSELPESMTGVDSNGRLIYSAANICNHYFSVSFLKNKVFAGSNSLYHLAHKKIPYYDPTTKKTITPDANNGIKLEMFVFDVFPLADRWKIMEVNRDDEFAPVKNAPGSATDSPDTARALLSHQSMRWLQAAGANIVAAAGMPSDSRGDADCEISPLISYAGEGLSSFNGVRVLLPVYITERQVRQSMIESEDHLLDVVRAHRPPEKPMKYGTAGFRDEWTKLHAIFVRMGMMAALRSRSSGGKCTGVMITASHNPEKDNGIKIVDTDGGMLAQEWEPLAEEI